MDWFTAGVLAMVVVGTWAVVRLCAFDASRLALLLLIAWCVALPLVTYGCQWEGFADGPLPIECRA